jgi:chromosome segregation ATPase
MFGTVKTKLKKKYSKNRTTRTEKEEDYLKEFLNNELTDLEKLLSEEAKLKQMAEDKRQEINKAIERLEGKMSLFKEEVEKIRLQFRYLFENKEIETELTAGDGELEHIGEGEESKIKPEQAELEMRLQSKEEESNLLKEQITEMEERLRIEKEKKEQEIQELKKQLEEMPERQESV